MKFRDTDASIETEFTEILFPSARIRLTADLTDANEASERALAASASARDTYFVPSESRRSTASRLAISFVSATNGF
jgi:hypothetical protein